MTEATGHRQPHHRHQLIRDSRTTAAPTTSCESQSRGTIGCSLRQEPLCLQGSLFGHELFLFCSKLCTVFIKAGQHSHAIGHIQWPVISFAGASGLGLQRHALPGSMPEFVVSDFIFLFQLPIFVFCGRASSLLVSLTLEDFDLLEEGECHSVSYFCLTVF